MDQRQEAQPTNSLQAFEKNFLEYRQQFLSYQEEDADKLKKYE